MAIIDGLRLVVTDRPRQSPAAPPVLTRPRDLLITKAVAASVPEARHFARRAALRWAIPEEPCETLSLIVSELVTNVVLHSGSAYVTAFIVFDGVAVTVEVTDFGRWLVRDADHRVAEDGGAAFGRGLDLVRACTSRLTIHPSPAGTRVVAHLPVEESGEDQ
ncbi:ATP-binding protein [Streptomyces sp. NPDC001795]|uniref:ATP-binding protein n=1 Tax=Streptomyces sp. NPDC001795 TaxID=3154525 RepID=UPI003324C5F6